MRPARLCATQAVVPLRHKIHPHAGRQVNHPCTASSTNSSAGAMSAIAVLVSSNANRTLPFFRNRLERRLCHPALAATVALSVRSPPARLSACPNIPASFPAPLKYQAFLAVNGRAVYKTLTCNSRVPVRKFRLFLAFLANSGVAYEQAAASCGVLRRSRGTLVPITEQWLEALG
jgi:hypothetical protein